MTSSSARQHLGQVVLGKYLVDRLVGEGTFAWVFHGRTRHGKDVAVKVLRAQDPRAALRFAREARVFDALPSNPYVVKYLGKGLTMAGDPLIVLEYVDGITLKEGMRANPRPPVRAAVTFVAELCRAFAGLHQLGVAHRDVKPANILMPRVGGIKLIDFGAIRDAQGILKLLENEEEGLFGAPVFAEEVDRGVLVGTLAYMSPEQFHDFLDSSDVRADTQSDVFGLGVILYELLSGVRPFARRLPDAGSVSDALISYSRWRIQLEDRDLPPLPGVPDSLESIVLKALAQVPSHRHPDCRSLMVELVGYLKSGTGAHPVEQERTVDVALDDAMDFLTRTQIELPAPEEDEEVDDEVETEMTPRSGETSTEQTLVRGPAALFLRETDPTIELTSLDDSWTDPEPVMLDSTTSKLESLYPPPEAPPTADDRTTSEWKGRRRSKKPTKKGYRKR